MKPWLLLTIGLAGMGCATATATRPAAGPPSEPPPWFVEAAPPETPDGAPAQPTVVVEATSPTQIRYRTAGETVVPFRRAPAPSHVRIRTHEGMWIGAGIGVLAGVLASASSQARASADPDCAGGSCSAGPLLGGVAFGAIGLGLGAAVGAIIGKIESY